MMFGFVWTVAFDAFGILDSARKGCVPPLSTVLALRDTGVHVGSPNGCNIISDVEAPVYQHFCVSTTLNVPDV